MYRWHAKYYKMKYIKAKNEIDEMVRGKKDDIDLLIEARDKWKDC